VNQIDGILEDLERKTTVQVAVVVQNSIGTADVFDFSQRLFTKWGIGQAGKDNGLLVMMVFETHDIRLHTGHGLEGVLPDVICKRIEMEQIVPRFREGNYDAGMIAGIEEVVRVLSNPEYAEELIDTSRRDESGWETFFWIVLPIGSAVLFVWFLVLNARNFFADSKKQSKKFTAYPEMLPKRMEWVTLFGIVPIGMLIAFHVLTINIGNPILVFLAVLYCWWIITLINKRLRMKNIVDRYSATKNYFKIVEFYQSYDVFWFVIGILFPLPMLFAYFQYRGGSDSTGTIRGIANHAAPR